ncbi:MAG: CvpA family protein [Draconibacterium sp.]|nr:CvpA family protein [Draconibacterium sp.]
MNYIDIVLGILLILAAISGFRKGLIVELASLAALILGIWGAIEFSYITSEFLVEHFDWKWDHLNTVSFIITFIVIVILVNIVAKTVTKLVETIMLGFVNKLAGLVFGLLKGAIILSIVLVVFDKINEDIEIMSDDTKAESRIYEPLKNFAPSIFPFIDFWKDKNKSEKDEPWYKKVV